jgi:hypothetical protein
MLLLWVTPWIDLFAISRYLFDIDVEIAFTTRTLSLSKTMQLQYLYYLYRQAVRLHGYDSVNDWQGHWILCQTPIETHTKT